jgi:hypothetical protein
LRKEREDFEEMEESDGERAAGTDTAEERAIRAMPMVTALSYVRAVKDKERGVRVTLTFYNCREYVSCEKPQEEPIHLSKERSTMRACLQELIKRLEENHGNYAEALVKKAKNREFFFCREIENFFLPKKQKIENFFFCGAPDAPEDQAICLFAGLLANPDMTLTLHVSHTLWVARQNKLETPKEKDEVKKREVHECDVRTRDPDVILYRYIHIYIYIYI